jgi:hypothetical protein
MNAVLLFLMMVGVVSYVLGGAFCIATLIQHDRMLCAFSAAVGYVAFAMTCLVQFMRYAPF